MQHKDRDVTGFAGNPKVALCRCTQAPEEGRYAGFPGCARARIVDKMHS
jgi:hypothetical protein